MRQRGGGGKREGGRGRGRGRENLKRGNEMDEKMAAASLGRD